MAIKNVILTMALAMASFASGFVPMATSTASSVALKVSQVVGEKMMGTLQ